MLEQKMPKGLSIIICIIVSSQTSTEASNDFQVVTNNNNISKGFCIIRNQKGSTSTKGFHVTLVGHTSYGIYF